MRGSVDTPRSVSDAYVTTFTTSPVCGASTTRPWPTNIATCPGEASVPAEPGVGTRSPGVSRDSVVAVPSRICVDVFGSGGVHGGSCRDHKARTVTCGRPVRAEDVKLSPLTPCERHCGHGCWRRTREDDIANGQTVSIDPLNLLAVDAHANRSKGDGDTATWLPPYKPFRCAYDSRQIAVKGKYDLGSLRRNETR
jgi:hypothetical protein